MHRLTLFYDGQCPLCVKEMTRLRHADNGHCLTLINIHSPACSAYPEINKQRAAQILHGITEDGKLLLGLDATCQAWKVVGRGRWIGLSRWPIALAHHSTYHRQVLFTVCTPPLHIIKMVNR